MRAHLSTWILALALTLGAWAQPGPPDDSVSPTPRPSPTEVSPEQSVSPTPVSIPVADEDDEKIQQLEELLEQATSGLIEEVDPFFATPEASYHRFMDLMAHAGPLRPDLFILARRHLDLSDLSSLVRDEQGMTLTQQLYAILRAVEKDLDLKAFQDVTEEQTEVVIYRQAAGDLITLQKGEDGRWLFNSSTVRAIPALYKVLTARGQIDTWRVAMLEFEVLGLTGYQWLALLLLPLFSFGAGRLVLRVIRAAFLKFVPDELGVDMVQKKRALRPLGWLFASIVFWIGISALNFPSWLLVMLTGLVKVVITLSAVLSCFRASDAASTYLGRITAKTATKFDDMLIPLVRRTFKTVIGIMALLFLAQNLEIEVWSLFAGFSIFGAMVALAGQDMVKNLFGSVTVLTDRPFAVGDWVEIEGVEGIVEDVGFRSTRIRTFYDSLVTLPNSRLITASVDNYGARTYRRYVKRFPVRWSTSPDKLEAFCEGTRELIRCHPMTRKDSFQVWVNDMNEHAVEILLWVFFKVPDWGSELRERHRLLVDIHRLATDLEIEFAYPTQKLYITQDSEEQPKVDYDLAIIEASREKGRNTTQRLLEASLPKDGAGP